MPPAGPQGSKPAVGGGGKPGGRAGLGATGRHSHVPREQHHERGQNAAHILIHTSAAADHWAVARHASYSGCFGMGLRAAGGQSAPGARPS